MAFPPAPLPVNRTNATAQNNNHPNDHNAIGAAVNDTVGAVVSHGTAINDHTARIVALESPKLRLIPAYAAGPSLDNLRYPCIQWQAQTLGLTFIDAHVTVAVTGGDADIEVALLQEAAVRISHRCFIPSGRLHTFALSAWIATSSGDDMYITCAKASGAGAWQQTDTTGVLSGVAVVEGYRVSAIQPS